MPSHRSWRSSDRQQPDMVTTRRAHRRSMEDRCDGREAGSLVGTLPMRGPPPLISGAENADRGMPRSGIWGTYQEHLKPAAQEGSMAVGAPECGVPENSNWAVAPRGQGAGGCRIRAFAWLVNEPWPPGADASCEFCQKCAFGSECAAIALGVRVLGYPRAGGPKARGDGGRDPWAFGQDDQRDQPFGSRASSWSRRQPRSGRRSH